MTTIAGQKVTVKGKLGELSYSGRQLRFNKKTDRVSEPFSEKLHSPFLEGMFMVNVLSLNGES